MAFFLPLSAGKQLLALLPGGLGWKIGHLPTLSLKNQPVLPALKLAWGEEVQATGGTKPSILRTILGSKKKKKSISIARGHAGYNTQKTSQSLSLVVQSLAKQLAVTRKAV